MTNSTTQTVNAPVRVDAPPMREQKPRGVLCPFCGEVSPDLKQCRGCRAFLDPLSRQATQNEMGPWYVRDAAHPFRPGCSFDTIRKLVKRGLIGPMSVIRGPTTRQSWSFASRVPSVGNLMGLCHNCQREVNPDAFSCADCGASFAPETDRQHLGLAPVHLLPGQAAPEEIASAAAAGPQPVKAAATAGVPVARLAVPEPAHPESGRPEAGSDAGARTLRERLLWWRGWAIALMVATVALGAALMASLAGVLPR